MVIDTAALPAILLDEPERRLFNELVEEAEPCMLSVATLVEEGVDLPDVESEGGAQKHLPVLDQDAQGSGRLSAARPGGPAPCSSTPSAMSGGSAPRWSSGCGHEGSTAGRRAPRRRRSR